MVCPSERWCTWQEKFTVLFLPHIPRSSCMMQWFYPSTKVILRQFFTWKYGMFSSFPYSKGLTPQAILEMVGTVSRTPHPHLPSSSAGLVWRAVDLRLCRTQYTPLKNSVLLKSALICLSPRENGGSGAEEMTRLLQRTQAVPSTRTTHDGAQRTVTPLPGDLPPSSGFHQKFTQCRHS